MFPLLGWLALGRVVRDSPQRTGLAHHGRCLSCDMVFVSNTRERRSWEGKHLTRHPVAQSKARGARAPALLHHPERLQDSVPICHLCPLPRPTPSPVYAAPRRPVPTSLRSSGHGPLPGRGSLQGWLSILSGEGCPGCPGGQPNTGTPGDRGGGSERVRRWRRRGKKSEGGWQGGRLVTRPLKSLGRWYL